MAKQKKQIDIPLTKAELDAPITSKNFFRRALAFHQTTRKDEGDWLIIKPPEGSAVPSAEWLAWCEYFQRFLGWTPMLLERMINHEPGALLAFTVPCEEPEHFDPRFRRTAGWKPPSTRGPVTTKQQHKSGQELLDYYGSQPRWDIKDSEPYRPDSKWVRPKERNAPTDDELLTLYGKQQVSEPTEMSKATEESAFDKLRRELMAGLE